ncbi:MAG: C4-type zinc ribbon domain-containing protein [Dehalococcoidia bacterium]|nr:C4-type zinc ribbon domain-containing protein [Dehalococcoidia bacterium]
MSKVATLYELQKVDLEIGAKEKDLEQVLEQLGDDTILVGQRQMVEEVRGKVEGLEKRRQSLDWEASDLQAKIAPLDKKLYSGQVKVPKELMSLQQEVEMFKGQRRQLEDAELKIMEELEESNQAHQEESQKLATMETEWTDQQEKLSAERDDLSRHLDALRAERDRLASQVDAPTVATYQRIRERRQGIAVATVARGTCTGCRITITAIDLQRARAGRDRVFCQSCGRILLLAN